MSSGRSVPALAALAAGRASRIMHRYVHEAGVAADGPRLSRTNFIAVVVGGLWLAVTMMPPRSFSAKGRSTPLRAPQADVEHVRARVHESALERGGECGARETDVASYRHVRRLYERGVGAPDVVGNASLISSGIRPRCRRL